MSDLGQSPQLKQGASGTSLYCITDSVNCFIEAIRGKTIVFNAYSANRKEYIVPNSIELMRNGFI